jgi:hypothetical protein
MRAIGAHSASPRQILPSNEITWHFGALFLHSGYADDVVQNTHKLTLHSCFASHRYYGKIRSNLDGRIVAATPYFANG